MYNKIIKDFGKINPLDTIKNKYANTLLVMLNYMKDAHDLCKNTLMKTVIEKDFCKYFELLQKEMETK